MEVAWASLDLREPCCYCQIMPFCPGDTEKHEWIRKKLQSNNFGCLRSPNKCSTTSALRLGILSYVHLPDFTAFLVMQCNASTSDMKWHERRSHNVTRLMDNSTPA